MDLEFVCLLNFAVQFSLVQSLGFELCELVKNLNKQTVFFENVDQEFVLGRKILE